MAIDSAQPAFQPVATIPPPTGVKQAPPARFRYRLRFEKSGDLRLVSHHDLMHCFERMMRRAQIPVARTQGFHPQPRITFALSLALGIAGLNEVVELELTEALEIDDLLQRLTDHAPPGLRFFQARRLEGRSSLQVRRASYRLPLSPEILAAAPDLERRCAGLLAAETLWITRTRPSPRRLDIRHYLENAQVERFAEGSRLSIVLWVSPNGTARPEEVVELLGLQAALEEGAFFERCDLELLDESGLPMPEMPGQVKPTEETSQSRETPAAARPTALVSGPMAYET